jgi:hypothetical protein
MAAVRISMAADLADALVADGIAVRPFLTRGAPGGDLVSMVIDGVNTGAAIVTLLTAEETLRKVAGRVWARLRHRQEDVVTLTITVPGEAKPHQLKIHRDDTAATDKILDFLVEALPSSHGH